MTAKDLYTQAAEYGIRFDGTLVDGSYHKGVNYDERLSLAEVQDRGGKITRLRLLTEMGRYDISYCHATLPDGSTHSVYVDGEAGTGWLNQLNGNLIAWARREGVYAKGIDLLSRSVRATLYG